MASEAFVKLDVDISELARDLFTLCELGELAAIEALLKSHERLNITSIKTETGQTPVHVASANGQLDVVRFLIGKGVSKTSSDQFGDTPLHLAARNGHLLVVTFLKEQTIDLNTTNETGETAVHAATRQGHLGVVEFLHLSGANVNIQNGRGSTALHIACQKRNTSMALMLLHLGCSMNLADQMDEMAIHDACREGMLTVVQTMCSYGCSVDTENKAGLSPLHLAAKTGNAEIVRCLLLSGADIDKYNKDGVRAEDIAMAQGHNDVADLLSRLSASITEDKRDSYVSQLLPTSNEINCLKIKVFGSGGVGKTTLIDSLKCGYIWSLIRRVYSSYTIPSQAKEPYTIKPRRKKTLQVPYETCTKGITVEPTSISGAGEVSIWEFSGYEQYYGVYDYFIGDPNCLHLVVISMKDPAVVRRAQLEFWLNFIRARIAPAEPFGFAGNQLWAPHVLLVATHADLGSGCTRNLKGELTMDNESKIMEELEKTFHADLILSRRFIVLDAHQATSTEIKNLRMTIAKSKELICQYLPMGLGFLEKTIAELPNWNKMLPGFPVIRWSSFMEYIRTRVNLLATEEHLKELAYQLQVVGEIVYLEAAKEDLVIINPQWLGTEIIGKLLSYEVIACAPESGRMSLDDLRNLFPRLDGTDLVSLLEALNICVQCSVSGELEFAFPMLNILESPSTIWTNAELRDDITCGGGIRVISPPEFAEQFIHIYPRVVVGLHHAMKGNSNITLIEWSTKCKMQMEGLAAVVSLVRNGQALDIECRGSKAQSGIVFAFQQKIYDIVVDVFQQCCPGIYLEQNPISPSHLMQNKAMPHIYTPRDILVAQLEGRTMLQPDNSTSESLTDIIAFGSNEVFSSLILGVDLHISNLALYSRCQLAVLLDPHFQTAGEQDKFAMVLGLEKQQLSELTEANQLSNTDKMLALWSQNPTSTIRLLCQKFNEYERPYAATLLLSLSPTFICTNHHKVF